jgi:signal recognition particle subunit SRP72
LDATHPHFRVSDIATRQVAQHNLLVGSKQPSNPYITHKLLDTCPQFGSSDKPFKFQQRTLDANSRAAELQALKYDGVARSTAMFLKSQQTPSTSAEMASTGVLNAAAHARGEGGKAALKRLQQELERSPHNIGLLLTIIQIYVSIQNPTSAINLLESFFTRLEESSFEIKKEVRFNPGLVAVAVALYRSQGRRGHATRELERAASFWRQTPNPPTLLLQAAGAALLESPVLEDNSSAAEIFTKLHEMSPEDRIAAAGYVAAYAGKDPLKVKDEVEQLTSVSHLTQRIDMDSLENAGIPQSSNALAVAQKTATRKRGAQDQGSNKPKKVRKSRLPKDYDPSKAPDPERWLPLRDRSTYKPKGKKGKKRESDRTQGGIVSDELGVKDAGSTARPSSGVVTGGGGANKKNKKKGKR